MTTKDDKLKDAMWIWQRCKEIARGEHVDNDDCDYSGGQMIIELSGATNSLYAVLKEFCNKDD